MRTSRQYRNTFARCAEAIGLTLAALVAAQATRSPLPHSLVPIAVYLVKETGELKPADLKAHPEVAVVHTWAEFQERTSQHTLALWIDKGAMSLVPTGEADDWLHREPQKWYPVIMVGYSDDLYAFREILPCFGIEGPSVDWSQRNVEPGFSLWKLQAESQAGRSATLHGFKIKPTVNAIERLTAWWLSAHKSQATYSADNALQGSRLQGMDQPRSFASPQGVYAWLSSDQLLIVHPDGVSAQDTFFQYDTSTRHETPLSALTELFRQCDGGLYPQISPDGRWALWTDAKAHHVTIFVSSLDGKHHFSCPKAKTEWDNPFYYWLQDSRHWVELVAPQGFALTQMRIHSVDKPQIVQTLPFEAGNPLNVDGAAFSTNDVQAGGHSLVLLPSGSCGSYCNVAKMLQVSIMRLLPNVERPRTCTFPPPLGVEMHAGVVLSPKGDRIAWFFGGDKRDPPAGRQLVPGTVGRSDYVESLWISKVDGSDMHEVGFQECKRPSNEMGDHMMTFAGSAPGNLLWLPDGKHLSFQFQERLYIVAAR